MATSSISFLLHLDLCLLSPPHLLLRSPLQMSFSELITLRFPVPLLQIQICHLPHYPPFLVLLLEPEDEHEAQLDLNNPLEPKEPKPDLNDPVEPEESEPDLNPFANFPLGTFPSDLICWIERRACSLPTLAKYHSIG